MKRWNSPTRDKGFGEVAMNPFNHDACRAIGHWMQERVAAWPPPTPRDPATGIFTPHTTSLRD